MGQYFDAVVNPDMQQVFNGTPEEIVDWLNNRPGIAAMGFQVCVGKTMRLMSVNEYLLAMEERDTIREELEREFYGG